MTIRKATLADFNDVLRLVQLVKLDFPGFYWHTEAEVTAQVHKRRYYVITIGQRIVGILNILTSRHSMDINVISVDPQYQRRGIGKKLIKFARDLAQQKRKKILAVFSFKEYKVKDFYLRMGFKLMGESSFCKQPYWTFLMSI